jgi:hypothetical protein
MEFRNCWGLLRGVIAKEYNFVKFLIVNSAMCGQYRGYIDVYIIWGGALWLPMYCLASGQSANDSTGKPRCLTGKTIHAINALL